MANINVTYTENTITVDENTSNVTVATTTNNITVSSASVASNADIRAAISATTPITYNSTTGVIGINSNAILTGKTTTDLPEGANLYFTNARVAAYLTSNFTTTDIPEGANLYYTTARANAAFNNIVTSNVVTFENVAVFNEGIRTPLYDAGNVSGTVLLTTENGTAQEIRLTGNVGYLSFSDWLDGQVLHVVVKQDSTGGRIIDFTNPNYAANGWEFYNADTAIDTAANAETLITIQNFSSKRYATIHTGNSTSLTNAQVVSYIANNSLTVGGNLTVNTNATISGNNITVANILIPGWDAPSVVSPGWTNKGYIKIPGGGNLFIGGGSIDIPGAAGQPINLGKPIYSPYSATFEQALTVGSLYADGGGNVVASGNVSGTYILGNGSQLTGMLTNAQVVSYIATQPLTVGGNLTVNGNINATGNINYQNVTDLYVTDQKITLNSNAATNANVEIISNRPTATSTMLKWNEPSTRWEFTNNGTTYYPIPTSTSDLAEGTNLYFTAARVRGNVSATSATGISYDSGTGVFSLSAIPNSSLTNSSITINGKIVALGGSNTLTTSDVGEGTNLYYTTDRANTAIGAYQGSINTPGNITAGNVITASIHSNGSSNVTINSNSSIVIRETIKGVATNVGNINGDGYAFFLGAGLTGQTLVVNSSAGNLDAYFFTTGNATAGSNVITGASIALINAGAPSTSANLNVITPYYTVSPFGAFVQDPFPAGTYVTSVDAANSTITLNNPAAASRDLSVSFSGGGATFQRTALFPGAFDANTGFLAGLISQFTAGAGASKTAIIGQSIFTQGAYGYPATGPAPTDFVYSIGNSTNYSQGNLPTNRFMARTKIEAPTTVFQAPRGLIVGNGDLTGRAENDSGASFGINLLWDGLTTSADYLGGSPSTQILLKQYSDNSFASGSPTSGGPRIFFTAARGNKNQSYLSTYPRANDEMGRLIWWGPTQYLPTTSTINPPAWISGVATQDFVNTNSGMGMYFASSPNTSTFDRSLYLASVTGKTLISSAADSTATHQPVIFAPSHLIPTGPNNGNSVFLYNQTVNGTETAIDDVAPSGAHFAQINYANATALTGAKISVTNGNNFATVHEGNIVLSLDRNSNTANVKVACRTGATNYNGSLNPDRVRFTFAPEGLADGTAVTISGFTNATLAAALNGNVFYVKRNDSAGYIGYDLYTDSGLTTAVNLGVGNVNGGPGVFEYTRTNSVTAKEWTMVLAQGSNNLVVAEDGVTRTTFASGGNVDITGNINLTGRLLGYDQVYGEFCYTAGNIVPAAPDTIYAFPLDTTNMSSDVIANNTSRINIVKPGRFKLITSIQVKNSDNANDHLMRFWLRKNGTDVANSATLITPLKLQEQVVAMDWMVESDGDDYFEIVYYVNDTDVTFPYYAAGTTPVTYPAAPPIIVNVIPIGA